MQQEPASLDPKLRARIAWRVVVLFGVVSLLSDVTYEGARGITGPYLGLLGAGAAAVGAVAGLGELLGYALRLLSGWLSDRTRRYWGLTFLGYGVNLLAVPALALAGTWEVAAGLIILERTGKALRTPARDVLLSHAASAVGRGRAFGLHEAMDQIGAVVGPLVVAGVLAAGGDHATAFAFLLLPALLALGSLGVARRAFPRTEDLEPAARQPAGGDPGRAFRLYLAGAALLAAGFADFPLVAFHLQGREVFPEAWIPALYAVAMAVDAVAALVFGRQYDAHGLRALAPAALLSALAPPLVFLAGVPGALLGLVLWGASLGAQESVVRAAVADLVPVERRGTAYGRFHAVFGLAWFAGSALMGALYEVALPALVAFAVAAPLAAITFFLAAERARRGPAGR